MTLAQEAMSHPLLEAKRRMYTPSTVPATPASMQQVQGKISIANGVIWSRLEATTKKPFIFSPTNPGNEKS